MTRRSNRHVPLIGTLLALLGLTALLSACGDDNSSAMSSAGISSSTVTTAGGVGTPTTAASTTAGTTTVSVPASKDLTHLTAIRVARHDSTDRITFEFDGGLPGYDVGYIDPPLQQDASGQPVALQGAAILKAHFVLASGVDLTDGLKKTYNGDMLITPPDTQSVVQLAAAGDFEGNITWGIGTKTKANFQVSTLTSPSRVVIDVS